MSGGISAGRNLDVMGAATVVFLYLFVFQIICRGWVILFLIQQPGKGAEHD